MTPEVLVLASEVLLVEALLLLMISLALLSRAPAVLLSMVRVVSGEYLEFELEAL